MNSPYIEEMLNKVAGEIRAASAIAIVGAGASIGAGYPLTSHLAPHVWKAIDTVPGLLQSLAMQLGRDEAYAKTIISDDETALSRAYELIKAAPVALRSFQDSFRALDRTRTAGFSIAHDALAEMLHRGLVETVVSLNWDTMLEKAYQRRYGRLIRPDGIVLHKPHGDAADLTKPWVLPNEAGVVTDRLIEQINSLVADRPRILLIVGYSERDEAIVQRLIQPLEDRWRVVRIGPRVHGSLAIPLVADDALPKLRTLLTNNRPEVPGWEYVTFQNQNDLGAALDGRGLGPSDVVACPRLPEVKTTVETLRSAHSVVIEGAPGSGKSMVAYHVAFDFCQAGWEILRLVNYETDPTALLGALDSLSMKTVVLVDDAQRLQTSFLRGLGERAQPKRPVVLVTNARPSDARGVIHISGKSAVKALGMALRERAKETLAIVHRFDPRVGEGALDIPLERSLAAAETADLPWQFSFILSAGERRARNHVLALADDDHSDLLLAAIAMRQLVTRDTGVTYDELEHFSKVLGRNSIWACHALDAISRLRLVVGLQHFKCPHQRYASAVLRFVFENRRKSNRTDLISLLRAVLLDGNPPLSGIAVLLRELDFSQATWGWPEPVVDDELWLLLSKRCLEASSPVQQGSAAYLLEVLGRYYIKRNDWLLDHSATIGAWIAGVTSESAWGLAHLMNSLYNENLQEVTAAIYAVADPTPIAKTVISAPLSEAYVWSFFLGRLALGGEEWRACFRGALSNEHWLFIAQEATLDNIHFVNALAVGIASYDGELAYAMIEQAAPCIAASLNDDFSDAYSKFDDLWNVLLGFISMVLMQKKPSVRQRFLMRKIASHLNADAVAKNIECAPRRFFSDIAKLLSLVGNASPRMARQIAERINLKTLDHTTKGLWEQPPMELEELVGCVASALGEHGAVQDWVGRHESEFRVFPARFVALAPDAALRAYRSGARVNLGISGVMGWQLPTYVLYELAKRDKISAQQIVISQIQNLADEFRIQQANQCEQLDLFVAVLQEFAPDALDEAFERMDPVVTRKSWAARLRGSVVEKKAAATLIQAVSPNSNLAEVAIDLRRKYVKSMRFAHPPMAGNDMSGSLKS